jgi:hypothetical protein
LPVQKAFLQAGHVMHVQIGRLGAIEARKEAVE